MNASRSRWRTKSLLGVVVAVLVAACTARQNTPAEPDSAAYLNYHVNERVRNGGLVSNAGSWFSYSCGILRKDDDDPERNSQEHWDQVARDIAPAIQLVRWPSNEPIEGEFELQAEPAVERDPDAIFSHDFMFRRADEPSPGWEALLVDGSQMPSEFVLHAGGETAVFARWAPLSYPTILGVSVSRVGPNTGDEESAAFRDPTLIPGNDLVRLTFSELVSSRGEIGSLVRVVVDGDANLCQPKFDQTNEDNLSSGFVWQCEPLPERFALRWELDAAFESPDGVSLGSVYGKPAGEGVTFTVEVERDLQTVGDSAAGSWSADGAFFEDLAGIAVPAKEPTKEAE